jgi:nitrogen regulatory protein P-II 1
MNMIIAIIRPSKLDEVKEALAAINVLGMTVTEAKGFGRTGGKSEVYRGSAYVVDFVPKVRIEVVVPAAVVEEAVDAIMRTAKTGKIGDGKLFVLPV